MIISYSLMSLNEDIGSSYLQNWWMLDLEDLHSIIISFHYYFALSMNMNRYLAILGVRNYRVEWIVMMEDLFKSYHSNYSILSITVDKGLWNVHWPIITDCRFGRSKPLNIQHYFNTSNHKGTINEIIWLAFNWPDLNGLQSW